MDGLDWYFVSVSGDQVPRLSVSHAFVHSDRTVLKHSKDNILHQCNTAEQSRAVQKCMQTGASSSIQATRDGYGLGIPLPSKQCSVD